MVISPSFGGSKIHLNQEKSRKNELFQFDLNVTICIELDFEAFRPKITPFCGLFEIQILYKIFLL